MWQPKSTFQGKTQKYSKMLQHFTQYQIKYMTDKLGAKIQDLMAGTWQGEVLAVC